MALTGGGPNQVPEGSAATALVAALVAFATSIAPHAFRWMTRSKIERRKAALDELRYNANLMKEAQDRLVEENARLLERVRQLEADLREEENRHDQTRERYRQLEEFCRMMGWRRGDAS